MTVWDQLLERRAELYTKGGATPECWERLGVANRHLERISNGVFHLSPAIENEIIKCFERVEEWINSSNQAVPIAEQS